MRYYVEFFQALAPGNYWRPCGDRGVAIIDVRLSPKKAHIIAESEMIKRGFDKYEISKAASYRDI